MMEKINYFNFVKNSPWPLMISMSLMNFFMSFLMMIKMNNYYNLFMNILVLIFCVTFWFMDLNMEINFNGMESLNLEISMKLFFMLFITSELMIFFSLFWSNYWFFYVPDYSFTLYSTKSIKFFMYNLIPMMNTFILILSSVTLTLSHYFIFKKKKNMSMYYLVLTILLGLIFTLLQYKEYKNSFFNINDGFYGSIFFLLTGLHGLHVILGNLALKFSFLKMVNMEDMLYKFESFEMSVWYWHFVDLMWLFVIYSLYFLNN